MVTLRKRALPLSTLGFGLEDPPFFERDFFGTTGSGSGVGSGSATTTALAALRFDLRTVGDGMTGSGIGGPGRVNFTLFEREATGAAFDGCATLDTERRRLKDPTGGNETKTSERGRLERPREVEATLAAGVG